MSGQDGVERFSGRAEDYVRYRPDYPDALARWLHEEHGVATGCTVADIGAGTGISTRYWARHGHPVQAVEPNAAMRAALQRELAGAAEIRVIDGTAEHTSLPDHGVGLVSAATAFHWFEPGPTRREWARILAPGGLACVFWNSRVAEASPLLQGYEALLHRYGLDYPDTARRKPDDRRMREWFGPGFRAMAAFANTQWLDFGQLYGRMRSSSSAPPPDHPAHAPMREALQQLFDECSEQGRVRFDYLTRVFVGSLH